MVSIFIRDELINTAVNLKIVPPHSNIISKAIKQLEQPDASITTTTDLLKNDLGVSSKLISIANSPYYRVGMPVNNIERAVMMIGQTELKNILFCLLYISEITNYLKFKKKALFYMLKHSVFVAHAARILSKRLLIEDPEDVFAASLLHDIGKIVFFMNFDHYDEAINESLEKDIPLPAMEMERFGIDHQELGKIIALKWKLPPMLLSIIENHHNDRDSDNAEYQGIKKILRCADRCFYNRDEEICPEAIILKKEFYGIDKEIDDLIQIINI